MNGINTDAVGIMRADCPASDARSIRRLVTHLGVEWERSFLCQRCGTLTEQE